ncbi:MAG: hypothetical protein AB1500_04885 [Bacillota bacterium]
MMNQSLSAGSPTPARGSAGKLGYYVAVLTSAVTFVTFFIAILTPPVTGPYAAEPSFGYPFTDVVARFPRDYIWMYPAMLMLLLFVALTACVHHHAPKEKKVFSQIGLSFALISAAILITDYFLQVSVIQPSLLNGETEGVALLTQYNPHGVFIALEDIGYLLMSAALFCIAPVFSRNRLEAALRWIFIAGFVLAVLSFAAYSVAYGVQREYRFEVAVIAIDWTVLIVSGILLGAWFKRTGGA